MATLGFSFLLIAFAVSGNKDVCSCGFFLIMTFADFYGLCKLPTLFLFKVAEPGVFAVPNKSSLLFKELGIIAAF